MTSPFRLTAALATAAILVTCPPGAHAESPGFTVAAPGHADSALLPRELRAPPVCDAKPVYPRQAYRKGLEGLTVVRTTIGVDGRIRVMSLFHSSGSTSLHREMDDAVSAALGSCHWDVVSPASFDAPTDVDVLYRWKKSEHDGDF